MAPLTLSFILALLSGFFLISALWPQARGRLPGLALHSCLSVGIGFGLSSCLFFLWLRFFGASVRGFEAAEIAICFALGLLYAKGRIRKASIQERYVPQTDQPSLNRILSCCFYLLLASGTASFFLLSFHHPHGGVDAWGIWNVRARFLFRSADVWTTTFSGSLANLDYPLLLPGFVARCWKWVGKDLVYVPILTALCFCLATVGVISSGLSVLRNRTQGYLAGILLLGTTFYIDYGTSQYADIPISFYFVATFVLLSLYQRLPETGRPFLILAGLTSGLATWTKNEGWLFLLCLSAAYFFANFRSNRLRGNSTEIVTEIAFFLIGLAPVLMITLYFKLTLAPVNYLIGLQTPAYTIARLTDLARHLAILKSFLFTFCSTFQWMPAGLLLYLLIMRRHSGDPTTSWPYALTLCFMLVGYYFAYVITPLDLRFHLESSLGRLLLQLWPSFIFIYFLVVRQPTRVTKAPVTLPLDGQEN